MSVKNKTPGLMRFVERRAGFILSLSLRAESDYETTAGSPSLTSVVTHDGAVNLDACDD